MEGALPHASRCLAVVEAGAPVHAEELAEAGHENPRKEEAHRTYGCGSRFRRVSLQALVAVLVQGRMMLVGGPVPAWPSPDGRTCQHLRLVEEH